MNKVDCGKCKFWLETQTSLKFVYYVNQLVDEFKDAGHAEVDFDEVLNRLVRRFHTSGHDWSIEIGV